MAELGHLGLYVSVGIRPTEGLVNYLEAMPPEYGVPLKADTRHVSTTYPYDFLLAGIENSDPAQFEEAEETIRAKLAALDLDGGQILPEEQLLVPKHRHMLVFMKPTDCIRETQRVTREVVKEIFGVAIRDYRDDYHVCFTLLPEGMKRPRSRNLPFPNGFLAKGNTVKVVEARDIPRHMRQPTRKIDPGGVFARVIA